MAGKARGERLLSIEYEVGFRINYKTYNAFENVVFKNTRKEAEEIASSLIRMKHVSNVEVTLLNCSKQELKTATGQ